MGEKMGELGFLATRAMLRSKSRNIRGLDMTNSVGASSSNSMADMWESCNLVDAVQSLILVMLYVMAWFARILQSFLPQKMPTSSFDPLGTRKGYMESPSAPEVWEEDEMGGEPLSSGPVGRALYQVLSMVNDLPASSSKYAFARGLAEKMIWENAVFGRGYEAVNKGVLCNGFRRTLTMLTMSLEEVQKQSDERGDLWSLGMKVFRMLPIAPSGGLKMALPSTLSLLAGQIGQVVFPSVGRRASAWGLVPKNVSLPAGLDLGSSETGEKFAQELLWLADKLTEAGALEEGMALWSSSASLAASSLSASPRVQRALVRLSALFVKEMVSKDSDTARDVKFRMLLLWLPLCCAATHGGDGPILNIREVMEFEETLGKAVKALPDSQQEAVMSMWLQEFAMSSSDWPNLQSCYDGWCKAARTRNHLESVQED